GCARRYQSMLPDRARIRTGHLRGKAGRSLSKAFSSRAERYTLSGERLLVDDWEALRGNSRRKFGHLIPLAPIQTPAGLRLPNAAPLLEEEGDSGSRALLPDFANPLGLHRTGTGPALAANDHPVDPTKRKMGDRTKERLHAQEAN